MTDQVTATDLAAWLSARYDEREQVARRVLRFSRESYVRGPAEAWVAERRVNNAQPPYFDYWHVRTDRTGTVEREIVRFETPLAGEIDAEHIAQFASPARVLDDIAVKRAILADHVMDDFGAFEPDDLDPPPICLCCKSVEAYYEAAKWPCRTVRLLASEFAGEPGYLEEWST